MTNSQSDRLDMYKAVVQFIEDTNAISSTRAGLITGKNDLRTFVTKIETAAAKQSTQIGGTFDDKNTLQENLCQKLFLVTSGTAAYASSISDDTLKEQMNYSITELRRMKDDTIVPVTNNIIAIVTPLLGAPLNAFGVDAAALAALTTARDAYLAKQSKPREAQTEKAAQTLALDPFFKSGTKICREVLDKTAVTLKATQPDWYNQYVNVRKIINTGGGTTTLEGDVQEQGTNAPIYNVHVLISKIGEPDITTSTDVNGHYKVIPIARGTYTIKFTHSQYNELTLSAFEIIQGHTVTKNVFLVRIP